MKTISQQISELEKPALIATDEGTHGMPDTVRVYETLDGGRFIAYYHGGSEIGRERLHDSSTVTSEHGRIRWFGSHGHHARKQQIAHLRRVELEKAKSAKRIANERERLTRGWDGYQFVGVERGREILAAMDAK